MRRRKERQGAVTKNERRVGKKELWRPASLHLGGDIIVPVDKPKSVMAHFTDFLLLLSFPLLELWMQPLSLVLSPRASLPLFFLSPSN